MSNIAEKDKILIDQFHVKKRKTDDEAEYANYCQLSFKVKNKNVTMLHDSK